MGQQQLILILLGTIIVGVAVAVGIVYFQSNAVSANKHAIREDMNVIAENARAYYLRPSFVGGGGNSYTGYSIPAKLRATENGTYTVTVGGGGTSIVLKAVSVDEGGDYTMQATLGFYRDPLTNWSFGSDFEDTGD